MIDRVIENLLIYNMGLRKDEKILIFSDTINELESVSELDYKRRIKLPSVCARIVRVAKSITDNVFYRDYPSLMENAQEPPKEIWKIAFGDDTYGSLEPLWNEIFLKQLSDEEKHSIMDIAEKNGRNMDVIIALSNFSTSHTFFRKLANSVGIRYASMPLFDESMFVGALSVDPKNIETTTHNIYNQVKDGESIKIYAPNGTKIEFAFGKRRFIEDLGILKEPSSFGNLPSGEVFIAPLENKTNGVYVIEYAPTYKLKHPLGLIIKDGIVSDIEGNDEYRYFLESVFDKMPNARIVAELGIGTNRKASNVTNILESEKIYGSIHVALGDNSSFGGLNSVSFHQDYVLLFPTVIIEKHYTKYILSFDW